MALDSETLLTQLRSHASALGVFHKVYGYEPKTSPSVGAASPTIAFWVQQIGVLQRRSGLAESAALVTCVGRLYMQAQSEPADAIDPAMSRAVDLLLAAYHGDFELSGTGVAIDLMRLTGEAGYIRYDQGSATLRMFTITIPIEVMHAWTQAP